MENFWINEFRSKYGNKDFIDGITSAMEMYAVWRNGKRYIGVMEQPLDEAIHEVREQLGRYDNSIEGGE